MVDVLFIIAPENFRDEELFHTKSILDKNAIKSTIASTKKVVCKGALGGLAQAELTLEQVNVEDYNAIVFVGGGGVPIIRKSPYSISIAKNAYEKGKLVAAICWAPTIFAKAGILKNKNATVWVGCDFEMDMNTDKYLESCGAKFQNEPVVVDGNIITANGPKAAGVFGEKIAEYLIKE